MPSESTMVAYYARRAQEYERIFHKPERQEDLRTLRELVRRTFTGQHVLEVACGTGYWTEVLSGSAASVTAIDINDEVLEIARAKPMDHSKIIFERADAYALQEFPRQFSAGLAGFWWSHIPNARLRSYLSGLHRKLAPDATMMFIDNTYVEGSSTPLSRSDAEGNTYQRRKLDDGSTHEVLKNFPTEKELRNAVDGLASEVEVQFLTYYWVMSYVPRTDV